MIMGDELAPVLQGQRYCKPERVEKFALVQKTYKVGIAKLDFGFNLPDCLEIESVLVWLPLPTTCQEFLCLNPFSKKKTM